MAVKMVCVCVDVFVTKLWCRAVDLHVIDWQEKLTMEKRLDDSDVYIVSLQEKIKALVTEKETLLQAKKALEEEKEQYQVVWCNCRKPHLAIKFMCCFWKV